MEQLLDFFTIVVVCYIIGYAVTKFVTGILIKRAGVDIKAESERVQDYILNKSRYFYIDEVDSSTGKLLLVYDYLDHQFVMQGATKDELKDRLTDRFGDKDLYFVNKPAPQ